MRRLAFAIAILGIFILLFFLQSKPLPISSLDNLSQYQPNQKFLINGQVLKESYTKTNRILTLNNDLKLQCPRPCPSFLNKNISASVLLEKYNNKEYLKILKIRSL
jgi:hypothetical protein